MNSRNGTLVDGTRLTAGEVVQLKSGQELVFGTPDQRWQVTEVGDPGLFAEASGGDLALSTVA